MAQGKNSHSKREQEEDRKDLDQSETVSQQGKHQGPQLQVWCPGPVVVRRRLHGAWAAPPRSPAGCSPRSCYTLGRLPWVSIPHSCLLTPRVSTALSASFLLLLRPAQRHHACLPDLLFQSKWKPPWPLNLGKPIPFGEPCQAGVPELFNETFTLLHPWACDG